METMSLAAVQHAGSELEMILSSISDQLKKLVLFVRLHLVVAETMPSKKYCIG